MEGEINKLSNKRDAVFRRVRKLLESAQQAQNDAKNIPDFEVRYDSLNEFVNLFQSLHLEIVSLVERTQLDEQDDIQTNFDSIQYSIKSIHRGLVKTRSISPVSSIHSQHSLHSQPSSIHSNRGANKENVRLPRIEIPKFEGDIKNWPTFFDMFETLIHGNTSLSDIERFQYLVSYLAKDALTAIKNLPLTAENYKIAYDSLIARYQNPRVLMTNYWQNVSNASVADESAASLRKLISTFADNLAALDQFKNDLWDFTKFNWLLQKVHPSIKTRFEIEYCESEVPAFKDLLTFLEKQCRAMETSALTSGQTSSRLKRTVLSNSSKEKSTVSLVTNTIKSIECLYCKEEHSLLRCDKFLALTPHERYTFVKQRKLCFNCLSTHSANKCTSKFNCKECNRRHHTLLHFLSSSVVTEEKSSGHDQVTEAQVNALTSTLSNQRSVLFATALVNVQDTQGAYQKCRVLLDSASEANFISESCAKRLGLTRSSASIPIQGLNEMSSRSTLGAIVSTLTPLNSPQPKFQVEMLVIPNICGNIPSAHAHVQRWSHVEHLPLADPEYSHPGTIDILLGAEMYAKVLVQGLRKGNGDEPSAISTIFGWVLMGKVMRPVEKPIKSFYTLLDSSLDTTIKRFWEVEQVPTCVEKSADDIKCEKIFLDTHRRTPTGRYVVELPFIEGLPQLGDSYNGALRRFLSLENRLLKNPTLHESYSAFLRDYLEQDHMSVAKTSLAASSEAFYIPHHCVLKPDSASTKIRVVFDASAKTSSGISLNDTLFVGPKLQRDICSILLVFRLHPVAFTADIRQMYRQVLVAASHRDYQRILWRFSKSQPVQEFTLNTVTYGVSCSPYLAIRALLQLASDEGDQYPLAAEICKSSIYVDDVVTGANSREIAREMQSQLVALFAKAGFELRKWASNDHTLLGSVPEGHQQPCIFSPDDPSFLKVLGLQWCPNEDVFSYKVDPIDRPCTKRNVLSELARIYDPLGLLSPLTLFAKHFMQCLWSQGLGWDEEPPPDLKLRWLSYKSQLPGLSSLTIPRKIVFHTAGVIVTELHGFCDASEKGYAAVVYVRQSSQNGQLQVSLVCAKSKVSPLQRISIPRLELCAAVLLADLLDFVVTTYKPHITLDKLYAWSDSTIALSWICSSPHKWKSFVANRVSHIQSKLPPSAWHHIPGGENPADCASRGVMPEELSLHPLWWTGPNFLSETSATWLNSEYSSKDSSEVLSEQRLKVCVTTVETSRWIHDLVEKFSSLPKIQRIVAYSHRFVRNLRLPKGERKCTFSSVDLYQALVTIVRSIQGEVFQRELICLKNSEPCSKPIRKLAPFLDAEGVIRVGGRLRHSDLTFDAKHPMLLPRAHRLTELIIQHLHHIHLHPGLRTLQYLISQQFWILSPRRAINHVLSRCYKCIRANPSPLTPMMGNLPASRVSALKAFSHTGVDFAGPVFLTMGKRRGVKSTKGYICVFVCFATKALHLEVVSNLSSEAFLAALRRFIARRGRCNDLYSDCGTNFIGANKLLSSYCKESTETLGINWHFNPPSSPHFGGLWEAGVKAVKSHLKRVIGEQILSYEELSTVLCQIESVLNSRPLSSLSSDPNDLNVLTPGHFLTFEPLAAPPDEDVTSLKITRLNRWQLVQRMHQDFWRRWHIEYLHTLQQRQKWTIPQCAPKIGDMVVIKDGTLPPLQWRLGRILKLYSGSDGTYRVAQVRTSKGVFDRPLVKLCPLPSQ